MTVYAQLAFSVFTGACSARRPPLSWAMMFSASQRLRA